VRKYLINNEIIYLTMKANTTKPLPTLRQQNNDESRYKSGCRVEDAGKQAERELENGIINLKIR